MIRFVAGELIAKNPGSDAYVHWLALRLANGAMLTCIFDYQGLSTRLVTGKNYELALELTYPTQGSAETCWKGSIADLRWPSLGNVIARDPLPKDFDTRHKPTGPLCILLQTPFGCMLTTMSQLAHYIADAPPRVGSIVTCPAGQRLDLIAVLG